MTDATDNISIADILGAWIDPGFESGLIDRCRKAWNKPLRDLTRNELATLLRQKIAVAQLLPVARMKLAEGMLDDTEIFDGELQDAIDHASKSI